MTATHPNRVPAGLAALATTLVTALLLGGCSAGSGAGAGAGGQDVAGGAAGPSCTAAPALALVVGAHANAPRPDVPAAVGCTLRRTLEAGHPVMVVALDGDPFVVLPRTVFPVTTENEDARADDVTTALGTVVRAVRSAAPRTAGSNVLDAVGKAADGLRSGGATSGRVVVVDSGLSDRGDLAFTAPGMMGVQPLEVATALADRVPRLAGLSVELVGFGYATAPQQPLTPAQRDHVADVWKAVLATPRAGATVTVTPVPRTGEPLATSLPVTPVDVAVRPVSFAACSTAVFDDASPLGFTAGTTRLRDEAGARTTLQPLADWLRGAAGHRAELVGTTSSEGGDALNRTLSARRAERVRDLLVELHAPADRIAVAGQGYTAQPPDTDTTGRLDPARAALNRTVQVKTTGC